MAATELERLRDLVAELIAFEANGAQGDVPELLRRGLEQDLFSDYAYAALSGSVQRECLLLYTREPLRQMEVNKCPGFGRLLRTEINAVLAAGFELPDWMRPYPEPFLPRPILDHAEMLIAMEEGGLVKTDDSGQDSGKAGRNRKSAGSDNGGAPLAQQECALLFDTDAEAFLLVKANLSGRFGGSRTLGEVATPRADAMWEMLQGLLEEPAASKSVNGNALYTPRHFRTSKARAGELRRRIREAARRGKYELAFNPIRPVGGDAYECALLIAVRDGYRAERHARLAGNEDIWDR